MFLDLDLLRDDCDKKLLWQETILIGDKKLVWFVMEGHVRGYYCTCTCT